MDLLDLSWSGGDNFDDDLDPVQEGECTKHKIKGKIVMESYLVKEEMMWTWFFLNVSERHLTGRIGVTTEHLDLETEMILINMGPGKSMTVKMPVTSMFEEPSLLHEIKLFSGAPLPSSRAELAELIKSKGKMKALSLKTKGLRYYTWSSHMRIFHLFENASKKKVKSWTFTFDVLTGYQLPEGGNKFSMKGMDPGESAMREVFRVKAKSKKKIRNTVLF